MSHIELSHSFPEDAAAPRQCGIMCRCHTPAAALDLHDRLEALLGQLAKECSTTGKASDICSADLVIAADTFIKASDVSSYKTYFFTIPSALGKWYRFKARTMCMQLEEAVSLQNVFNVHIIYI